MYSWGWKSRTIPSEFPYTTREHQGGKCLTVQQKKRRLNVNPSDNLKSQMEHVEKSQRESPGRPQRLPAESLYPGWCRGQILSCNCRAELCSGLGKYRARLHYRMGVATSSLARKVFWSATEACKVPGMPIQDEGGGVAMKIFSSWKSH